MLKSIKRRNSNRRPLQKISIDKNIHENIISNINNQKQLSYVKFDSGMNTIINYFDSKIKKVSKPYKKSKIVYITKKPLSNNEEKNNNLNNFSFSINYFPQKVNEYLNDIFLYYLSLIKNKKALFGYMDKQRDINIKMRSILIDWLIDVHLKFHLLPETLYITINLIDNYLSQTQISRKKLQLVGITCLFIADKYEEIYPPELKDHVDITDKAYSKEDILNMEIDILKVLKFDITYPTSYRYFEIFFEITKNHINKEVSEKVIFFGQYLMELSMIDYNMLKFTNSEIAICALYLSYKINGNYFYSRLDLNDLINIIDNERKFFQINNLEVCTKKLYEILENEDKIDNSLVAVKNKFLTKENLNVANWRGKENSIL